MKTKHIILGTDARGLEPNATVISSLLAHTEGPVWVRIFSRDVTETRLESGRLTLEVIPTPEHLQLEGGVPAHVDAGGTFDRIAAIPYCADWEQAAIFDYDQLVIGDPTELFEMDLGEALAAGCLWGRSLGEACREWFGRELPERWAGCADYQYFYMGPVLNLKALREDGAYERFVEFTREAGMEEQIGLHIACQDRIVGINPNLNVITSWDGITKDSRVLHFTGPRKPWNHPELPGAQYWRAHETTWVELTCGLWNTQGHAAKEDGRLAAWNICALNPPFFYQNDGTNEECTQQPLAVWGQA